MAGVAALGAKPVESVARVNAMAMEANLILYLGVTVVRVRSE
jgi:hypothetical protein